MAFFHGQMAHTSGIPLGGLGTGSVEIRPDGYFHEWQIFNLGRWAPRQPQCCQTDPPELPLNALEFFVRAQAAGSAPLVRRLGVRSEVHDLYSFAWAKSVAGVGFWGGYPVARLTYADDELPVQISGAFFSPFIPHDARSSGTPGFYGVFRVQNTGDKPVEVSLMGTLANPLAWGAKDRKLINSVDGAGATTFLTMRTNTELACKATLGSLSFSVTGGEASWVTGEFPEYMRGLHQWSAGYGSASAGLLYHLRERGRLPSLSGGVSPGGLAQMPDEALANLPGPSSDRLISQLRSYPVFNDFWERVRHVEPRAFASKEGRANFLKECRNLLNRLAGQDRARQTWGSAALCSSLKLEALEEKEVVFALAWFFPHHYSALGPEIGHMYENWFKDAEDVNRFLVRNFEKHRRLTCSFADTLNRTTLPGEFPDAWAGQLTTLPKCTWWVKSGEFAVWEGLGCCGFHTTDITYQGSFGILALFPELQKRQMEMGARFQREDGRVHHFFTPDLTHVDKGFDRVDMNQQFVLLACRDYLWTGDRQYLQRLWPHILRAMENTRQLDGDGDGLPDHDTRRNTYDAWNFFGTPSYIASLWLSALLAAARLADELGQTRQAARWRALLKKAVPNFDRKLWNGEYYSLWVDGQRRDECCMTDQIDGEWFTQLIGLGHCLPRERIQAALRAVVKHNYRPEEGLINAGYPPGRKPVLSTYRNVQAMAPWTGIEYAIGSMLMDFGLPAEGTAVVRNIDRRHTRAGRFWNHVECGDHYYRAMCSWAVLLAATGFKLDVPAQRLTLAPPLAMAELVAPWVSTTGWGAFRQTEGSLNIECRAGKLSFRELHTSLRAGKLTARLNDRALPCSCGPSQRGTAVKLRRPVVLMAGDVLVVC